jgi:hypothetical protein
MACAISAEIGEIPQKIQQAKTLIITNQKTANPDILIS